jgi:Flp pilus assembly pilin Flp
MRPGIDPILAKLLARFVKDQSGATAIKYGLIAAAAIVPAWFLDGLGGGPLSR